MFLFKKTCHHEKISACVKSGYCPDCGEYVENCWFVTRCPICGKRHKTIIRKGKPIPSDKFCSNCGCQEFVVEEIDFPDIVSINYAAYISKVIKIQTTQTVNAWVENTYKISLLPVIPV